MLPKPFLSPEAFLSRMVWILLGVSWVSLFSRMSLWWNEASYYTHGWGVPLLALVLLAKRLPEPLAENGQAKEHGMQILFLPALLFLCFRFIGEPDPFWRLPLWGEMIFLSLLSGLFFHQQKAPIRWQTWLLVSIYLMTALPWPAGLETKVVHGLTNLISQLTTETLLLSGFPAEMVGNSIRVDQLEITINQACSGIRSLQNLLSFAVFLLIYFRFDALRSCFLFGVAATTALLCNLCRALTLSFVFLNYGESTQVSWHDTIGNFYVILSMVSMFLYAWYVKPTEKLGKHPLPSGNYRAPHPPISRSASCVWIGILTTPPLITLVWFSYLCPATPSFVWQANLGTRATPLDPGVYHVLQYDYGNRTKIELTDGSIADVISFGYEQDSAAASLCSRNHPPDYCMGYSGIELTDSHSETAYPFNEQNLFFRHYSRRGPSHNHGSSDLHVFWGSFTLDSRILPFEFSSTSPWGKAGWFLSGKLSYERKVLLITLEGKRTQKEATACLFQVLEKIIQPIEANQGNS
jgi:exosortase/archaeosortase family protein